MTEQLENGTARARVALNIASAPGDIAMPEVEARYAALRVQFRHDNTIDPLSPQPGQAVEVWATSGEDMPVKRASLFWTTDGSLPGRDAFEIPMEVTETRWDSRTGFLKRWLAVVPGRPENASVRYRIGGWLRLDPPADAEPDLWAHDGQGFWFHFPGEQGITTFAYDIRPRSAAMPAWMHDAVIYHIFLDRFHPGNDDGRFPAFDAPRVRHGGTLRGVRQSLPYLEKLGITCLWFSPIHPSETYHRYDGMDFFGVDSDLGTEEDLRCLIDDAHARGMRIWLDFVPAHSSWHHPAFLAAQSDRNADTYSWYTFNEWPNSYRSFLQVAPALPSFNVDDPGARAYLIDSAVHWVRDLGVDGFRLDHAIAPSMDFWVAFRRATEDAKADVVNVGEATDTPDSLRRYRAKLHGILDFPLARALRLAFGKGIWGVARFDAWLESYERFMGDGPGRVSFLDNHDMDRFLWVAENDVDRLRLAALCQFTLSATPVIYYGTEIGMTQMQGSDAFFGADENARGDMLWDESAWDADLLRYYRALIEMRRNQTVLGQGGRRTVHVDDAQGTFGYVRTQSEGGLSRGDVLTVFNLGDSEAGIRLPAELEAVPLRSLVETRDRVHLRGREIVLGPRTGAALEISERIGSESG